MKEKIFDKKEKLLEVAIDEFTIRKYEDASLNNIIKNAGVSKGTFYYHFKDKQDLYLYLLESGVKLKWEFLQSHIKEFTKDSSDKDIFDTFKIQARIGVEFAKSYPKYYRLGMMFIREKGNKIYEIGKILLGSNTESLLEEMIDNAINKRQFKSDVPKEFIHKLISYLLVRFDEIFCVEEDIDFEIILRDLDYYVDFMKYGLGNTKTHENGSLINANKKGI